MTELELYYNKFNEEKRLDSRHGQVEFITSMKYLHKYLEEIEQTMPKSEIKILDVGAATGRYSVPLAEEGYDVTAVELVKHNLARLKAKGSSVKAYQGNAMKLKRFEDNTFDVVLVFGPMYHLHEKEEKKRALSEAKRVVKPGGKILVAYIMNEYSVITYAIKERHIKEGVKNGMLDEYIKRHDEIWEEMKDMLHEAGIRNYSIWNVGNDLFGYYECDSIEKASLVQANSPVNAKWDEYMQDVMVMTKDPVTGAQPLLKQVFYFD